MCLYGVLVTSLVSFSATLSLCCFAAFLDILILEKTDILACYFHVDVVGMKVKPDELERDSYMNG